MAKFMLIKIGLMAETTNRMASGPVPPPEGMDP